MMGVLFTNIDVSSYVWKSSSFFLINCFVAKNKTKTHLLHIYSFSSNPKHCPSTICYDLKYGSTKKSDNASL